MHLIIEGIDTVYTPKDCKFSETWHGLQTALQGGIQLDGSNAADVFCPIVSCGIKADFDIDISEVPVELQEYLGKNPLDSWKMILADCRNGKAKTVLPLHVPKKGYKIHQNKTLFDAMIQSATAVLGKDNFVIATLGVLGGYSQFFVSIAIKGQESFNVGKLANKANDSWKKFFNLNSSHNGLISSNRMLSFVRMVCFNTVQMAISDASDAGTLAAIKHTENSESLITPEIFEKDLRVWIAQSENFQVMLQALKEQKMTVETFKAFSAGVFTNRTSDELSTNSYNRIEEMTPLFQLGNGNRGETRYDAVNAFTEYFTSGNGVGNPKNVGQNKRVATANFGRGNEWKIQAMLTATKEDSFADCVKRGGILYDDKSKLVYAGN
jgi:hypothetical protein